jgi:hypothetical protein
MFAIGIWNRCQTFPIESAGHAGLTPLRKPFSKCLLQCSNCVGDPLGKPISNGIGWKSVAKTNKKMLKNLEFNWDKETFAPKKHCSTRASQACAGKTRAWTQDLKSHDWAQQGLTQLTIRCMYHWSILCILYLVFWASHCVLGNLDFLKFQEKKMPVAWSWKKKKEKKPPSEWELSAVGSLLLFVCFENLIFEGFLILPQLGLRDWNNCPTRKKNDPVGQWIYDPQNLKK